jgi:hypothetical protein
VSSLRFVTLSIVEGLTFSLLFCALGVLALKLAS